MNSKINKLNRDFALSLDTQQNLLAPEEMVLESQKDTSCRLYRGDNAIVLKQLVENKEEFDFCYIDPPYNTRNKFIYNDSRVSKDHLIWGSHSEWIEFMAERLISLHELLKNTGIVAISIDDYEQPYLRILMDKIFGEDNFIACIAVCRSKNGKGSKPGISTNHEYVVVYGKSNEAKLVGTKEDCDSTYDKEDEHGKYKVNGLFRKKGDGSHREDRPTMFYPLYHDGNGNVYTENITGELKSVYPVDSKGVERRWLWGKETATTNSWKLYASANGVVYVKNYFTKDKRIKPKSLWHDNRHLTERATNQIKAIYGSKVFDTPKPIDLIEDIIDSHTHSNAKIIDFFAGTGTTAHAAHNLNLIDGGGRQVVLVEQEQEIAEKHAAYKSGYRNIADITEGRLSWLVEQDKTFSYEVIKSKS
ncbi:Type II methyltransferase M.KpnI [Vibrio crassostreae]|uniref:site-specific DNA-methyltransferase n=1 Tax=Vibrio TaxID=662 RepID=UPI000C85EDDD|nr:MULTISPECIES: site-specific DNA-methyltransferase [Vibrio]MCG9600758.1 site-specific DNA-methyltransferase [Vibrio sp. Isolate31]PMG10140.1 modification methylase [Vibrio splendidus]CAK2125835.1 Type II methyltransferase M.KpnI [Vibrio crassostreae]CAK2127830.1 Type II methyltransferase M.KpnI [Vibrio crassostreae]CAK2132988.1 Type II methyltransferase M.KpnI [Vibrio crassostreae]